MKRSATYQLFKEVKTSKHSNSPSTVKPRPPPILTGNISIGANHMIILIEAWNYLKTVQHPRDAAYVQIFPQRLPCYEELGIMSLIVKENPEGIFILSNLDYFRLCAAIQTPAKRPTVFEYYMALCYFRGKHAATEDTVDMMYSSDEETDEYDITL